MVEDPPRSSEPTDPQLERMFVERERNRFAGRALSLLVVLNGAAALVLMTLLAQAPESSVDPKIAVAMLFFSGRRGRGPVQLLPGLCRSHRAGCSTPAGRRLRGALSGLAIAAVIGSGAAFVMGMNMVARVAVEKTSSHPKGSREDKPPTPASFEKV